jgi:ribosomal-protein-alanine N-acetyltransferase
MRASREFHGNFANPPVTPRQFDQYIKRIRSDRHAGFLVCRRKDEAIVGVINVNEIIRGIAQSAFLGYYVGAPYAGQGHMTEGLELVLRLVFGPLKLHRVEANIRPENRRSIALAKRCGFVREGFSKGYLNNGGRWRDYERWALVAEDWKAQRRKRNSR